MDDEDYLAEVVIRLRQMRRETGPKVFRQAAYRALVAIAKVVLEDVEDRTKRSNQVVGTTIKLQTPRRD